ncbi:hypothetical protein [Streptomyces sp. NPDC005374]|uniref:hypothetical protein n=1 Tax=Streptomyces sp. NPDC005374 TaxID=3364713 RepID=UPI00368BA6A5
MTEATNKSGADGDRSGHSPLVTPTETEAPDLGSATERRTSTSTSRGDEGVRDPDLSSGGRGSGVGRGSGQDAERGLRGTTGREAGLGRGAGPESATGAGTGVHKESAHESGLLSHDESDKLSTRLQHAVAGFVDEPRSAVEEADQVLEEAAARIADAVKQRRRTLRNSWQSGDGGQDKAANATDTEQLRLVLRDYRELAERLLRS